MPQVLRHLTPEEHLSRSKFLETDRFVLFLGTPPKKGQQKEEEEVDGFETTPRKTAFGLIFLSCFLSFFQENCLWTGFKGEGKTMIFFF